jgi:hypothetical protein
VKSDEQLNNQQPNNLLSAKPYLLAREGPHQRAGMSQQPQRREQLGQRITPGSKG